MWPTNPEVASAPARNLALTAQRPSSKAQSSSRISTTSCAGIGDEGWGMIIDDAGEFHGGSPNQWRVFVRENPIYINGWWLGVPPFLETSISSKHPSKKPKNQWPLCQGRDSHLGQLWHLPLWRFEGVQTLWFTCEMAMLIMLYMISCNLSSTQKWHNYPMIMDNHEIKHGYL